MSHDLQQSSDARLIRIVDRTGDTWARFEWEGDRLVRLEVRGATVHGAVIDDPLLGAAHAIETHRGTTAMTELAWSRPTEIPAIANPGVLPGGAGSAILDAIAILAQRAGVTALRYAGPYPTHALWCTLLRSFRTTGTVEAFTTNSLDRMLRRSREPIPIDFIPAPHERIAIARTPPARSPADCALTEFGARGHVELRDGVERAVIDGISYEPDGSPTRIVESRAEVWFGDTRYAHVATFTADGSLVEGPHAIPACSSEVIGVAFPIPLVDAIAELVADTVPEPLARDARSWLMSHTIEWADLGAAAARVTRSGIQVHAALWLHVGPHGLGRLALALAEAIAPVVTQAVIGEVIVMSSNAKDR